MKKSNKFSPEMRERAVRMMHEHRAGYPSLWAAVESMAPKVGCVPQTLLERVRVSGYLEARVFAEEFLMPRNFARFRTADQGRAG